MRYINLLLYSSVFLWVGCSSGRLCDCKPLNEPGAIQDENGSAVNQWLCRQVENAQQTRSVIFQSDWIGKSDRLSPFGRKRLGSWSNLNGVQSALYIETSGDQFLDSQRQAAVSGYLNLVGLPMPPESIQIANVDGGLSGEEIPAITDRFLGETGGQTGSQSGAFGGFSAGGQGGGLF